MSGSSDHVVVTGGAGYIGAHVCKALAASGYTPVAVDNLTRGHRSAVRWGPLEEADIRDTDRMTAILERFRPVGVIHMAALAYVRESVQAPLEYYDNNVGGSARLLEAMRRSGVAHIVFSSTCATYGVAREVPIPESHPNEPINPYGASKLMVERMLADAGAAHGTTSVALRYFNACGADPDGETGEWHEPETHVIPLCLMAAAGVIDEFVLLGDDHDTPDGTPVRDYIHVSDLAELHVRALRYLMDGGERTVLNVGTGRGYSVREVIAAVERVAGRPVPVRVAARHPADPPVLVAEGSRACALLDYSYRHTGLDEIVAHAWAWWRKAAAERAA